MNKVLFLLVNNLCHNLCTYCFYTTGFQVRSAARITFTMIDNVAERIVAAGFKMVILTGGDPLYSKYKRETFALVESLKGKGLKVLLNTSAARFDFEDVMTINSLEVDRVDISIDSCVQQIHDAQRGNFDQAVQFIEGLKKVGYVEIATTSVVTELSAPKLLETLLWLRDLGVKDTRMQRVFIQDEDTSLCSIIPSCMKNASRHLHTPHIPQYLALTECAWGEGGVFPGATCRMGKEYFVCDSAGGLSPCFHRTDIDLGNLFFDDVSSVLKKMTTHELVSQCVPSCFGRHCVSLFDNPLYWEE